MTETELTDRLREAIVLNGPDVWRSNGYLQDAQQAGLSLADALKRAAEISQEVANNTLLFDNIQTRIARLAQPSRSHLIEQDLHQIVNAATSLKLSADFVRNQWVPTVLQRLATAAAPQPAPVVAVQPVLEPTPEPPVIPEPQILPPIAPPVVVEPVVLPTSKPEVKQSVPERPQIPEPQPIVRSFTATPARVRKGDNVTLSWEVENLLAVTIDDLGEGLSPKNRGWVKPPKTMDYTLFDANNNPLSTVRVEVIPRDRSGIYGVLFALALLAVIYWFIKSNNARTPDSKSKRKTEQTTDLSRGEPAPEPVAENRQEPNLPAETSEATDTQTQSTNEPVTPEPSKKSEVNIAKPVDEATASAEPEPKPASPADARQGKYEEAFGDKPYDKVEIGADERGWRRARHKGRWGYINEADEWVIQPEFEAVTPFRGNTASVFLNGQLMTINRAGEQVRN